MYENEERITETEVVDGLRALLYGESLEDTLLDGSRTETYSDGGYLTHDEGFPETLLETAAKTLEAAIE